MKKLTSLLILLIVGLQVVSAQSPTEDFFRSIGKIYVVFAVILSIFAGLIIFLIWMERRISRIEKQINP